MNFKHLAFFVFITIGLSSCMDCMDCQTSTDINLSIEYWSNDSVYVLDSSSVYTYSGPGYIVDDLPNALYSDLALYLSPVSVSEKCGDELKDIKNSSFNYDFVVGDSSSLFKYSWTENWDCK